jgi:hypothetical protein
MSQEEVMDLGFYGRLMCGVTQFGKYLKRVVTPVIFVSLDSIAGFIELPGD